LEGAPSTVLNFGLANHGADDLTRIVVKVSILRDAPGSDIGEPLAGPYTLVGHEAVLRPGQTLDFKIRLRNLSSDCDCVARVVVLSAHSTRSVEPDHDLAPASSPNAPSHWRRVAATKSRCERQTPSAQNSQTEE
jgi:hypothetical protein